MDLNPGLLGISTIKIPVPWGHIAAKAWGNPETGKPILGVHGWMDNAGTFDTLIPLLPKCFYIVAIDAPGHGLSSNIPSGIPYHYPDIISSIRRVVMYLKWTKFSWLGHSMGASLGIIYSTLFPNEIDRVILLDVDLPVTNSNDGCVDMLKNGVFGFLINDKIEIDEKVSPVCYSYHVVVERLMKVMKCSHYPISLSEAKTLLIRGSRQINENQWTFCRDPRMISYNTILRFSHEQFFDMLNELKCHVLIIKSTDGKWYTTAGLSEKTITTYKMVCPSFKLIEVQGNHFVHLSHPNRVSKYIGEFLID